MPHVAFVPFAGLRVREEEMLELGMALPGLRERAAAIAQLPALGLLTLAGLMPSSWTCSYHEATQGNEALAEQILQERPTLVALSALTASVEEAYRLCTLLRRAGTRVILGGLHTTACPGEAQTHCDAVVVGEGEPVWRQILADADNGILRPVYRASGPFDLSQSPVPRFDLLGRKKRPRLTLQTQRGCPLACEFCGASRLLGPFREKPVSQLSKELEAIEEIVPNPVLELADDNTFAGGRAVGPFFDLLARTGARYFTEVDWRIGERGDVLRGLAASGCVQVLVGMESLVFRHSGMGAKRADLPRIMEAVAAIQEAGVAVIGCFIVGCDGESHASLDQLAQFILHSPFADIQITLQTPFPGTALYERLRAQGRLLKQRGWSYYTLFDMTYQPDLMGVVELESAFRQLIRLIFSESASTLRKEIRKRIWERNPRLRPCASERCSDS